MELVLVHPHRIVTVDVGARIRRTRRGHRLVHQLLHLAREHLDELCEVIRTRHVVTHMRRGEVRLL